MPRPRITVTSESSTGRNKIFHDNYNGNNLTRTQFVQAINNGTYQNYYVRKINGIVTPCSKPDNNKSNNLN